MKTLTSAQKIAKATKMREYRAAKKSTALVSAKEPTVKNHEASLQATASRMVDDLIKSGVKFVAPKAVAPKAVAPKAVAPKADTRKIFLLVKDNPYRSGSVAEATFELLRKSLTVEKFRANIKDAPAGVYDPSYLTWATQPHGKQPAYIAVK
jgi:hypothetical protein